MLQRHGCRAESSGICVYIAARPRSEHVQLHPRRLPNKKFACDIAGSRPLVDIDDAVDRLKAASSHEKYQLAEEVHRLKERRRVDKAANTMPSSVLQTEVQRLIMLKHFPICPFHVHLQSKQEKVEQLETGNPAPSYGVLRLTERARPVDRRLAR